MKKYIILLIMLLSIPLVFGATCGDILEPNKICTMLTPVISCTDYNYTIYNETDIIVNTGVLNLVEDSVYSFEFNQSKGDYLIKLCDNSTREIKVESSENRMISIILGLGIVAIIFIFFAYSSEIRGLKALWITQALTEIVIILFTLYSNEYGGNIGDILRINFYIFFIILTLFGIGYLILYMVDLMQIDEGEDNKKWSAKKKW